MPIKYKINQATRNDISDHLTDCKDSFNPPLDQRVDIDIYAQKIYNNADTFEAWHGEILIGLVAVYCNDVEKTAYITSVSVNDNFINKGVASNLLKKCIGHVESLHLNEIALKVNILSDKARKLYEKFDFQDSEFKDGFVLMRRVYDK